MVTIPREKMTFEGCLGFFRANDIHKWILASEEGRGGLKHWQIRYQFTESKQDEHFLFWSNRGAHFEPSKEWTDYERKGGRFLTSDDTSEIIKMRFGVLKGWQKDLLQIVDSQNDRQIDICFDRDGGRGKSWLVGNLHESGRGFVVNTLLQSAREIGADICNGYRGEPYILVDLARAQSVNDSKLWIGLEKIKDGLVFDARYGRHVKNIRGAKIVVFCNKLPSSSKLSADRWRIMDLQEYNKIHGDSLP